MSATAGEHAPYLSVVVTSRNDNHGGSLTRRMQIFVQCLIEQCKRHNLDAELVIVEWNPPTDRPKLIDALKWPDDLGPCRVRIIEVPSEIHARYKHGKELPLYQMIGKNVGIRRARGRFIVATNIDVIFNDELMRFLASRQLERGRMYRIDRTDVDHLVPDDQPVQQVLEYCQTHLLRVNAREGTFPLRPDGTRAFAARDIAPADSPFALGAGWGEPEQYVDGNGPYMCRWLCESAQVLVHAPAAKVDVETDRYLLLDLMPGPGAGWRPFELVVRAADGRELSRAIARYGRNKVALRLRVEPGKVNPFELRACGLSPAEHRDLDPRPRTYLVYGVSLFERMPDSLWEPDDIGTPGVVQVGKDWSGAYQMDGEICRQLPGGGELWVYATEPGRKQLTIDIEPNINTSGRPCRLSLSRIDGTDTETVMVTARRTVGVMVDLAAGINGFILRVVDLIQAEAPSVAVVRSIVLCDAGQVASAPRENEAITPNGVEFGSGWGTAVSGHNGSSVHRVALRGLGELWLDPARLGTGERMLAVSVECPDDAGRAIRVRAFDADAKPIGSAFIRGVQTLLIPVELRPDQLQKVVLRVDGCVATANNGDVAGHMSSSDVRLYVLKIDVRDGTWPARDVYDGTLPLRFGAGWHEPQQLTHPAGRWMEKESVLWLESPAGSAPQQDVALELEAAATDDGTVLVAQDDTGRVLLIQHLKGASTVRVPVDLTRGRRCLTFWTDRPQGGVDAERTLSLLVHRISIARQT